MSLTRQIASNTLWQTMGKVIGTVLGFAVVVILFNYLGEVYGEYTTVMAYLQLFGILMDLGLYIVLLKHIATDHAERDNYTNNIFTLRCLSAILFLIIACTAVWFINKPAYTTAVKWGVLITSTNFFFITINQLLLGIYQHHLVTYKVAVAEVIGKIVLFVSTVIVVYVIHGNLLAVLLTVVLAGGVNFLLLWLGLQRYTKLHLVINVKLWKQILQESWPVAIAIALNLIYFKADTIILTVYKPTDVGIYGFPYKILEVIITLPAIVAGLIMPKLGEAYALKESTRFKELYQRSFYALTLLALPLVVGTIAVAHPIMNLIVTNPALRTHLIDLGNLLQILIIAVGAIFLGTLTGYIIVIVNRQRQIIWGYAFVAATALIGYLYFIPRYSYYGAASVTVYSELMMMIISTYIVYRATGVLPSLRNLWRVLLACALMGISLFLLQSLPALILVLLGVIIYPLALMAVKGVSSADLKLIFNRNKGNA